MKKGSLWFVSVAFLMTASLAYAQTDGLIKLFMKRGETTDTDIQKALAKGADVNARDTDGSTPLLLALNHSPYISVIRALLKAKPDVNASDNNGMTPLLFACEQASSDVSLALLQAGAEILSIVVDWKSERFSGQAAASSTRSPFTNFTPASTSGMNLNPSNLRQPCSASLQSL